MNDGSRRASQSASRIASTKKLVNSKISSSKSDLRIFQNAIKYTQFQSTASKSHSVVDGAKFTADEKNTSEAPVAKRNQVSKAASRTVSWRHRRRSLKLFTSFFWRSKNIFRSSETSRRKRYPATQPWQKSWPQIAASWDKQTCFVYAFSPRDSVIFIPRSFTFPLHRGRHHLLLRGGWDDRWDSSPSTNLWEFCCLAEARACYVATQKNVPLLILICRIIKISWCGHLTTWMFFGVVPI